MDVVILLVFISLILVAAGLTFFLHRLREGDFDHGERLSLAPLTDDATVAASPDTDSDTSQQTNGPNEEPQGGTQHASC